MSNFDQIDQKRLDFLSSLADDEDPTFLADYLNTFLSHSGKLLGDLKNFVEQKEDKTVISKVAHALKGTCRNVGAEKVASYLIEIEENSEALSFDDIERLIDSVDQNYQLLRKDIQVLIENHKS